MRVNSVGPDAASPKSPGNLPGMSGSHFSETPGGGDPSTRPVTQGTSLPGWRGRALALASRPLTPSAAAWTLLVISVIAAAVILREFRGISFFYDEWDFIQDRRGWGISAFLEPHNEHLHLIPTIVFKALFVVFGIGSYWPYAMVLVITHIACAWVLFALVQRWSNSEFALIAATVFLFLGAAWEVLLWPFEMGVTLSLAAGLASLLALDHGTSRGDIVACALLVGSVASASLGIPFIVGALIMLLLSRRGLLPRVYVVLVPIVLYGLWYLAYGEPTAKAENIREVPGFVANAAAGAASAIVGLPLEFGRAIVVLLAAILLVALGQRRPGSARLICVAAIALIMWSLLGLSRFGIAAPETSRYHYGGAALLLVIGAVLIGRRWSSTPALRVAILVLVVASLAPGLSNLSRGAASWRDGGAQVRAALGALELVPGRVPADFQPAPIWGPQLKAASYLSAADALGSPAATPQEIIGYPASARAAADTVLNAAQALSITPTTAAVAGGQPLQVETVTSATVRPGSVAACRVATPEAGATAIVTLPVPSSGVVVAAQDQPARKLHVDVRAQRFADLGPGDPVATAYPGGRPLLARVVAGGSSPPWRVQLSSLGPITFCRAQ